MGKKKDIYEVTIKSDFDVEEDKFYYVRTDPYQYPRQLSSIKLSLNSGSVMYGLTWNEDEEIFFYEREISDVENPLMREKYCEGE